MQRELMPVNQNVIIDLSEQSGEQRTASGIIIPDTAKEKPVEGTVVAAGPGKVADNGEVVKMTVKVGDKVLIQMGVIVKIISQQDSQSIEGAWNALS